MSLVFQEYQFDPRLSRRAVDQTMTQSTHREGPDPTIGWIVRKRLEACTWILVATDEEVEKLETIL